MGKNGKKIKLKIDNKFKTTLGTVDNKNPSSLYITLSSWVKPTHDNGGEPYDSLLRKYKKCIKQSIFNATDKSFFKSNNTIVDISLKECGVNINKKSFVGCEITLFYDKGLKIEDGGVKDRVELMVREIIENGFLKSDLFHYTCNKS